MESGSLPRLLTAVEVAAQTGLPLQTVYALARASKIPTVRVGTRNFRFSAPAILEWIDRGGCSENGAAG